MSDTPTRPTSSCDAVSGGVRHLLSGRLKAEFFHLNRFDSVDQLQAGIRQYIRYCNHDRIKLKLKGLSPVQYRAQAFGL